MKPSSDHVASVGPKEKAEILLRAALSKKGFNPVLIRLEGLTPLADYFLILSGRSARHVKAVAEYILEESRPLKIRPLSTEGITQGNWALLDYGDVIVLRNNWGQGDERVQAQRVDDKSYIVKNNLYEKRTIGATKIYLDLDTSYGEGKYYEVKSTTGWLPRYWSPGHVFRRMESVTVKRLDNCQTVQSYTFTSDLLFIDVVDHVSRAGLEFPKTAVLAWLKDGRALERYYYAPGVGLVQWEASDGRASWAIERVPRDKAGKLARGSGCWE